MAERGPEMDNTPETSTEEVIAELKRELAEEKSKAENNLAGWQRAQADFVNYKRFVEQEKQETSRYAATNVILSFLPILDDFDRAIEHIPEEEKKKSWLEGFLLIQKKFKDILEKQGISAIECQGAEFDHNCMDAITCMPGKKDIVLQEIEKGYKLNDKVIRPAKVIVGGGEESNKEE